MLETVNLLLSKQVELADLSTIECLTVIIEKIDWTWSQNDLTQGKFSALIGAFSAVNSSITDVKFDAYSYE